MRELISYAAMLNHQLGKRAPDAIFEHRFHPSRMWRFDLAFPLQKIAVEIDGGIWMRGKSGKAAGAHSRPSNILRDMAKHNAAQELGWRVFRFTPDQVRKGESAEVIGRVLNARGEPREASVSTALLGDLESKHELD